MSTHEVPGVGADKLYEQLSASIRATDDISFKLLGLVPLVSGAALGTLLFKDAQPMGERLSPALITLLALFAAAVTLGLFRWELRNVQECSHLIGIAGVLARARLTGVGVPVERQARPARPQGIGKTEAEKIIYSATILAWLALPPAVGAVSLAPFDASTRTIVYVVIAAIILLGMLASLAARTRPAALEPASEGDASQRVPAVQSP